MFGNNGVMSGQVYQPPPAMVPQPQPQPHGQVAANNWAGNDANTLLVVSTLITTLTYQLGCSVPGGYWQDTLPAGSTDGKQKPHEAGDPIMRDKHWQRYLVFMAASWMGFLASMMMTLSLLVRLPVDSRQVRWSFAIAYSSLVLTFNVSQSKTHLTIDIIIWAVTVVFLWLMISVGPDHRARIFRFFCRNREN